MCSLYSTSPHIDHPLPATPEELGLEKRAGEGIQNQPQASSHSNTSAPVLHLQRGMKGKRRRDEIKFEIGVLN